jgi:hypothetical protein
MTKRRQNFQPISWFLDLYKRELLDMDPPFQRRSVWNDKYREEFIDTILLDYPVPAIFVFGRIDQEGNATFQLVDGKQRLTAVFDFISGHLHVGDGSPITAFRSRAFSDLPADTKIAFFEYDFPVEYLPTNNEDVVNSIFDRLNRNMARLTAQELRHAKFSGRFIESAEELSDWMAEKLPKQFPRITEQSRRQMKDVEVVATLLLFLEEGPKGYSVLDLDKAFSDRDATWENVSSTTNEFRSIIDTLAAIVQHPDGQFLPQSRFRNQADFYSLFAAIAELRREHVGGDNNDAISRLAAFNRILEDESARAGSEWATEYYNAARSASNDPGPRKSRIVIVKRILKGEHIK